MLAWQCGSTDFEITTEFLWIHVGQRGRVEVEEKITKLRDGHQFQDIIQDFELLVNHT